MYEYALSLPAEVAFAVVKSKLGDVALPVSAAAHSASTSGLAAADRAIVESLRHDGAAVTSLAEMGLERTDAMVASAQSLARTIAHRSSAALRYQHTLAARPGEMMEHRPIFEWGLQNRLLRIVEAYLGTPPAYDGPLFYYSLPDGRHAGIRRWHRDREDHRCLKIAVYFNDVDEQGGPFEMLATHLNHRVRAVGSGYVAYAQTKLEERFGGDSVREGTRSFTGRTGTMVFCDTAQHYHRGKPPTARVRVASFFSYFSRRPSYPFMCNRAALGGEQRKQLVQDLPEAARASALWRSGLPISERLVPINRVRV